ncbi:protein aurora borealis isoform X2 [Denticeps clupeoides]|uniref:protein aurora borealis isoform X2 n=1 Tax=Denticeps clupeoides TaxID=299321 RepID=UPI0010A5371C|nr:protein aurora borealis isoform X2 [Denticeps clupeoides]
MGDVTPGKPAVLNPFESPNDYHRLHEPLVPSPSAFKSSRASSATPAKFKWSIDEMANLLPVHIDSEDIHRQSLYLSQTRVDSEIEQKRQRAIDQFFTKGAIVPSPWAAPSSSQQLAQIKKSCASPLITEEPQSTRKINACQTVLSLPVDFNLENVLGEYYRAVDNAEQVQESLSSSSLRRKLFLDGNGSGSESSNPSSPQRTNQDVPSCGHNVPSSVFVSPLQSDGAVLTSSSGQFSSSPIQGRFRSYSLGSVTSPKFPDMSSPTFQSPTLSPINKHLSETPVSGEKKHVFLTPDCVPLGSSDMDLKSCSESPYVEGCSPIRTCTPLRSRIRVHGWASPILSPAPLNRESLYNSTATPAMELEPGSRCLIQPVHTSPWQTEAHSELLPPSERMEEGEVRFVREQDGSQGSPREEFCRWTQDAKEEEEEEEEELCMPECLTSSRMGSTSNGENLKMFTSLLAEGSIPPDISMQVDSGYNTYSVGANSLMDAISCDSQSKESFDAHVPEEGYYNTKNTKSKVNTYLHSTAVNLAF